MRRFYYDEGPIDTLLQIAAAPVSDGDLVSKSARDTFVKLEWVARCQGWNIITDQGRVAVKALALGREAPCDGAAIGYCNADEMRRR